MSLKGFPALTVVIIDDTTHMRMMLRTMLRAFGIRQVYEACDGDAGFKVMLAQQPDFVLTDYSMKPVNGVEFARRVRALNSPLAWVPVIMVTGHTERRYIEKARDAGVTEFLSKPVMVKDLFLRIEEVIERPRRFVKAPGFLGPDRRRRRDNYAGPRRREDDHGPDEVQI